MITKINSISALLAAVLILFLSGCSDINNEEPFTEPDLFKLGEFTENGLTVAAYADRPLSVGFNRIYFDLHRDEERLNSAQIEMTPMMYMEHHSHASPFEMPAQIRDEETGLFTGWAIFTMPGGMMGSWELQVNVSEASASGVIGIDVDESNRVKTFMTESEERYVLTWILPDDPAVGMNDLRVALHKRESMISFPAVENAKFDFEPWMPSMDHGSSNNTAPVHEAGGFYSGQVNFNMTGDWELRFDIQIDEQELGRHVFELDF
jgi:hypothetical protein